MKQGGAVEGGPPGAELSLSASHARWTASDDVDVASKHADLLSNCTAGGAPASFKQMHLYVRKVQLNTASDEDR